MKTRTSPSKEGNDNLKRGQPPGISRRKFIQAGGAAASAFTIVPRHVLGGPGFVAPSEKITRSFHPPMDTRRTPIRICTGLRPFRLRDGIKGPLAPLTPSELSLNPITVLTNKPVWLQ
jgi:hypothetical protein